MMEFRRNPRLYNDQINEVRPLRPLPVTPVKQKRSVISRALYPLIMVAAYGLMYYFNQTSLTMLLFPVIMLIPALVVPAIEDRQNWKEAMDVYNAEIIAYNEYLDALDLEFEQIKQSYQLWNAFDFPGTAEELDRCKNLDATLWCKRAEYNDFMNVCVGTYSAKFPVQLEVDYEQMVLHRDDKLKDKIKKLLDKYDVIENTPLIVNLRNHPCLGVCDNSSLGITQEYLAGILLSAIYSYGYDEVKIVVLAKNEPSNSLAEGKYQWTRWLPHCWDEDKKYRFFAATDSEKTNVLLYLTNICQERVAHEGLHLPHYLVLVEDVEFFEKNGIQRFFTQRKNTVGVSLIYISDTKGLPSQAESIVNINKMNSTFTNASMFGLAEIEITPRKAEIYDVEELSRFLSSVQLTDDSRTNELPSLITLFDLYGERSLSPNSIALNWAKNYCYTDGIHAVLGKKSPTEVMDLDMSDEHDGAHMLVAGTTGSGKSEFLQTFVVALASRYSPDEVSFVFIDFKEGGMSESFKELPHNAGSLTNIDDEIDYFAGRAITMLNNERKRRAKLLEPYGQKINRYHEAYHESGEHLVALPHLFIVIDEFAEVIAQCSEFKEMIISLSRVGRSLGIHLILATQSPSQSVDSQIWSNSNCKICLKVLNDDESNAVLKVKDAAYIQTRGRAYCLTGGKPGLIEFQTAWSGAPTSAKFLATKIEVINGVNERLILSKELGNIYTASTQLSQVCDTCKIVKTASGIALPHNVLTPSLPTEIKLQLDGEGFISGRHITDMYIGVGDFITEHKQEKVSISLGNGNNHLLIAGAPNSGRSNAVGQLVSQLEATCNASDIQFYIIQYGSKSLRSFDNSHIVAEYITNLVADISETEEKIGRTLTFIREIIKQRQIDNNSLNEPKIAFGHKLFSAGNTTLRRSGVFGNSLLFSQTTMNRRSVASLGNASAGSTPWYVKAGNFLRSGATSVGKKVGEFGTNVWNGASNFFSNAGRWGSERLNDLREWGKSAGEYTWKSITKFVLGDYSDDNITALSFAGNIVTGIFDVDLPLDVRDLVYDVQHWGEGDNFGVYFALDVVALLPVIGVLKYCKYADDVADGAKDLGKVIEAAGDVGKYSDDIVDAVDNAKDIGKAVDVA